MTCPKCGAPVTGPHCEYCGAKTGTRMNNGAAYIGVGCLVDVTASVDVSDALLHSDQMLGGRAVGGELRRQLIDGLVENITEHFDELVEVHRHHDLMHQKVTFTAVVTLAERSDGIVPKKVY